MVGALEDALYDGESLVETVSLDGARVAVTSHRLLVWAPEGSGAQLRAVERPNVTGVTAAREGGERAFGAALRAGVVGAVCLAVAPAAAIDLPPVPDAGTAALGGGLEAVRALFGALALLDEALRFGGALALLAAAAGGGWFLRTRKRVVRIGVAGGTDVSVRAADAEAGAASLAAALDADASTSSPSLS